MTNTAPSTQQKVKLFTNVSTWEINSDGYYPYCKHCGYEPSWEMSMNGLPHHCPKCGSSMENYEKFSK